MFRIILFYPPCVRGYGPAAKFMAMGKARAQARVWASTQSYCQHQLYRHVQFNLRVRYSVAHMLYSLGTFHKFFGLNCCVHVEVYMILYM